MDKNSKEDRKVFFNIEPKQNYCFDPKIGNTHAIIKGQIDGSYPTITFKRPPDDHNFGVNEDRKYDVLLTLHCFTENGMVLSPHLLMNKDENEPSYKPIFQTLRMNMNVPKDTYDFELKNYVIKRFDEKYYKTSFDNKRDQFNQLGLSLEFSHLLGKIDLENSESLKSSGELNVCLGVTVFNYIPNARSAIGKYQLYEKTFFSCNIIDGDDLHIHKICNTKGSINGGTRVTLLIKLISKFPIQIGIKKNDGITKLTKWSTTVEIDPRDIFDNHAITFCMPPYEGPTCYKNEIDVDLCVIVNQSTYRSNSVKFYYLSHNGNFPRKRLHNMDNDGETSRDLGLEECITHENTSVDDAIPNLKKLPLSDEELNVKEDINKVYEMITSGQEVNVDENVIHANLFSYCASCIHNCMHLYKLCGNSQFRNFIVNLRNRYGENLLHVACKSNEFKLIVPFISLGCAINDQDIFGRTPLHIAIDEKHNDCLLEIQIILKDISGYPPNVKTTFIEMLQAYNEHGYTVMHTAALGGHYGLLENLLKFCVKHQINVWDYGTLQSGDSIGHLIVKNKLMNLMPLLQENMPDFENIKNYDGQIVEDLMTIALSATRK